MKQFAAALALVAVLLPAPSFGQKNIIDYFGFADSLSKTPPMINDLVILGSKKIDKRYVTIAGYPEDKSVLLAAVTLKPIKNLSQEISLSVQFRKMQPNVGPTSTWGYIFDRNGDGKVDYMALLGGAAGYKDDQFPQAFPEKGKPLQADQVEYYLSHCRLVFNHWADDNFDDTLDAVVHIDMDPERDFVDRQIVARSTAFDGQFEDVWAFREGVGTLPDAPLHTATSISYHPIGKPGDFITKAMLDEKSGIMRLINAAVKKLKLTPKNFTRFSDGQ
jgi:hypothetical protein